MKYGVIWFSKSENLGDDIQAYAASKFLPQIDYFVEREHLDEFISEENEMVAIIMNGWYFYSHLNWPPSPFILPFPVSMHFDTCDVTVLGRDLKENFVLNGYGGDWLSKWGPIGARDYHTLHLLQESSIPAFFSGCLTLTLDRFEHVIQHGNIIAVDVPELAIDIMKQRTTKRIIEYTHKIKLAEYSISERLELVEKRLKEYQGAFLVVTTRLHAALPCLALGVPVLYIKTWGSNQRIETFLPFLNYIELEDVCNYDFGTVAENKSLHREYAENLRKKCKAFIQRVEDVDKTLSIKMIFEDSIERNNRLKDMILREKEAIILEEKFVNVNFLIGLH